MWKHFYCKLIIWYWFLSDELIRFLLVFLNNNTALSCMKVVKMKSGVPMDFLPPSHWASHSVLKKHKKHERSCWGLSSSIASPPVPLPPMQDVPKHEMCISCSEPEFQGFSPSYSTNLQKAAFRVTSNFLFLYFFMSISNVPRNTTFFCYWISYYI